MNIELLLENAKKSAAKRSDEERIQMLINAKILNKHGNFHSRFFTRETINKSKA